MRSIVLAVTVVVASGCSGPVDQNKKIVLDYLKKKHGNDPVTIVKSYGTREIGDEASRHIDKLLKINEDELEYQEAQVVKTKRMLDESDPTESVHDDIRNLYAKALRSKTNVSEKIRKLKSEKSLLPFLATRIVYRVPDERGENSLNDFLFIIKDGQVDGSVDMTSDHPFAVSASDIFAERNN